MQNRRCVATLIVQMSRCQVGRANPMKNILSIDLGETYFDDEVMMDLMRGSNSCLTSHFFMDQHMEMHGATPTLFCKSDFATVLSSAWTCQSNEKVLGPNLEDENISMMKSWLT